MSRMPQIAQALIKATERKTVIWKEEIRTRTAHYSTLLGTTEIRVDRIDTYHGPTFDLTAMDQDGLVGTLGPWDSDENGLISQLFLLAGQQGSTMERKQQELLKLIEGQGIKNVQSAEAPSNKTALQTLAERHCTCACCCPGQCDPSCRWCKIERHMCLCVECPDGPCHPDCLHLACSAPELKRVSELLAAAKADEAYDDFA